MIYKGGEIVINFRKCGKNMDLLTIEILTITLNVWLEFDLGFDDFILAIFDVGASLLLRTASENLFLTKNDDF